MDMFIHFRWLFIIFALLYFIPAIVGRKKRNSSAIFWLDFFLGWTVVGWVAALIWALKRDPQSTQVVNHGAQEWIRRARCGRHSPRARSSAVRVVPRLRHDSPPRVNVAARFGLIPMRIHSSMSLFVAAHAESD